MLQIFILAGLGIFSMIADIIGIKKWLPYITILVLTGNLLSIYTGIEPGGAWISSMYEHNEFTFSFHLVASALFLFWYLLFFGKYENEKNITEYISLFSFATAGGLMMLGYNHFVFLFLGLEILSIPVYILAGSRRQSLKSNESAFKYFIVGAFASSLLLLGIALVYGATGSFSIASLSVENTGALAIYKPLGILFILFSMAIKISAVPFQYWVPDVYEGAPTEVTAYMSTLVKAFAAVAMFRFISVILPDQYLGIYVLSAMSMLIGNILGAVQDNPKRTLAYSGIGHAGFMLMAILVAGSEGKFALNYYIAAYSLAGLLSFFVISKVIREDDMYPSFGDFNGLWKRSPYLSVAMTIALLSMAGIPPLSGFFGKYFVFTAAYSSQYFGLVIMAIIASLIGVYYYFKFIIAMFGKETEDGGSSISLTTMEQLMVTILSAGIIILGLFPDLLPS